MNLSKSSRNTYIDNISKYVNKKHSEKIEQGIYDFTVNYVTENEIPYLFESIYENKLSEILSYLNKKNSSLIKMIENNEIDPYNIVFYKIEELEPDRYHNILKQREFEEHNGNFGSDAFTCSKCKKSKCQVTQRQTRAGDEPPTIFVKCLECGHSFKFN